MSRKKNDTSSACRNQKKNVNENPAVSVIMATFNRSYCIERSIDSVLKQSYSDFEFIIVDDGSTDETAKLVQLHMDSRIKLIRLKKNIGQSAAINYGVEEARGDWIMLQDSDDESLPDRIEKQLTFVKKNPDYDGVSSRANIVQNNGSSLVRIIPDPKVDYKDSLCVKDVLWHNIALQPTLFLRRDSYLACGGFDELVFKSKDREFMIRFLKKFRLKLIDDVLVNIHISKDSITGKRFPESEELILQKHKEIYANASPFLLAGRYFSVGIEFLRVGNLLRANSMFEASNKLAPNHTARAYCSLTAYPLSKFTKPFCSMLPFPYLIARRLRIEFLKKFAVFLEKI